MLTELFALMVIQHVLEGLKMQSFPWMTAAWELQQVLSIYENVLYKKWCWCSLIPVLMKETGRSTALNCCDKNKKQKPDFPSNTQQYHPWVREETK